MPDQSIVFQSEHSLKMAILNLVDSIDAIQSDKPSPAELEKVVNYGVRVLTASVLLIRSAWQ